MGEKKKKEREEKGESGKRKERKLKREKLSLSVQLRRKINGSGERAV